MPATAKMKTEQKNTLLTHEQNVRGKFLFAIRKSAKLTGTGTH